MTEAERKSVQTAYRPFMDALMGRRSSVTQAEWAAAVDRVFPPAAGPNVVSAYCTACGTTVSGTDEEHLEKMHLFGGTSAKRAPDELKCLPTLSFVEGLLEIRTAGYGNENGSGRISFKDDDLDWGDGEDSHWRFMRLPKAELEAIRDFLNEHLPAEAQS